MLYYENASSRVPVAVVVSPPPPPPALLPNAE